MDLFSKYKMLVILGPTAVGKTDLALTLAKKFNGEIVSCDSRQVYEGLDIGTGKISSIKYNNLSSAEQISKSKNFWDIEGIRVWMYDVVDPKKQYTVADYVKDANRVISEIRERGQLPIIVGGTGLYLKALLDGLSNLAVTVNKKLRKKLEKLSLNQLQNKLQEVSFNKWSSMNQSDRENPRRLVRAIELKISPRRSSFDFTQDHLRGVAMNFDVLKIGLTAPRKVLYQRVDDRVISRINQGMIKEAKRVHKNGLSLKRMRELGLEYRCLADFLQCRISSEEIIKMMQNRIHGFVRRQLTWFKKERDVEWFDIIDENFPKNVEKRLAKWYHQA